MWSPSATGHEGSVWCEGRGVGESAPGFLALGTEWVAVLLTAEVGTTMKNTLQCVKIIYVPYQNCRFM